MTTAITTTELGDQVAAYLERHGPTSGDALAAGVSRLRTTVLRVLREDERFVRTGAGRATRWNLDQTDISDPRLGYLATNGAGGTPESPPETWSWERLSSLCTDPELHRSWRAHWKDEAGRDWCVRCYPEGPPPVPLTFKAWMRGEGSEKARECFEQDVSDMFSVCGASPEQLERVQFAMLEDDFEEDNVDATA